MEFLAIFDHIGICFGDKMFEVHAGIGKFMDVTKMHIILNEIRDIEFTVHLKNF